MALFPRRHAISARAALLGFSLVLLASVTGCASNMNLSESIMFADESQDNYDHLHVVSGASLSTEYTPRLDRYGAKEYLGDSLPHVQYLEFAPGPGYGIGVANESFAAAFSAQLFRLGADVTFIPVRPLYLTANVTTGGTFGFFLNSRVSRSFALGSFFRRDQHWPVSRAPFLTAVPEFVHPFYTESVGLKGTFLRSVDRGDDRLYYLGVGVIPRAHLVMFFLGMSKYGPF